MQKSTLRQIFIDFVSLFYPNYCIACYDALVRGEADICSRCMLEMPQTDFHLNDDNPLKRRLSGRMPLVHVLAFFKFSKGGRIQNILHSLKYKNCPEIGTTLGKVYAFKVRQARPEIIFDCIVPVPLHPTRLRKRGYNQSSKYGMGLADVLKIPMYEGVLIRAKDTSTQTKKSKLDRWENVRVGFSLKGKAEVKGKHVLLVDDVITTGATVEACGAALLEGGCSSLSVACIAVA